MVEQSQELTIVSSVDQQLQMEYSNIPLSILESFYTIRACCNLVLDTFHNVSKQISNVLYAKNCVKEDFNDEIKPYANAFIQIMYMNNKEFSNEENLVQYENHWKMYVVCRERSTRIVFVVGGKLNEKN